MIEPPSCGIFRLQEGMRGGPTETVALPSLACFLVMHMIPSTVADSTTPRSVPLGSCRDQPTLKHRPCDGGTTEFPGDERKLRPREIWRLQAGRPHPKHGGGECRCMADESFRRPIEHGKWGTRTPPSLGDVTSDSRLSHINAMHLALVGLIAGGAPAEDNSGPSRQTEREACGDHHSSIFAPR